LEACLNPELGWIKLSESFSLIRRCLVGMPAEFSTLVSVFNTPTLDRKEVA
jgi:hypothetical protein